MPIRQVGSTENATSASGTSVVVTKPTGVADGDVLIAAFTHNDQAATASGWTLLTSEVNGAIFRNELYYKVASSEGANYTFSVGAAAPLVATVIAWRGVDTSITPVHVHAASNGAGLAEPATGPTTGATTVNTLVQYFRAVRETSSTIPTFSEAVAGKTEISGSDVGVFSGGSVSYSHAFFSDDSENAVLGTKAGLATTCSVTEENNVQRTFALAIASETDTITVTEGESIAGTVVDSDTITITESERIDIPVADSESATFTETDEDVQQITEYLVSDNFNRDDESPLNISSSGHEWTNV